MGAGRGIMGVMAVGVFIVAATVEVSVISAEDESALSVPVSGGTSDGGGAGVAGRKRSLEKSSSSRAESDSLSSSLRPSCAYSGPPLEECIVLTPSV
ncbi:hypothetical protein BDY19DRAFT_945541 [Irpex rosettiformis]|uniref:Uncharacterized protein n=1 Tax=Irpex rosettiformis TaxID=378272 RepID=A0ACB8U4R5_9APHY|nr:hypothetical protein BDY19DRAFT_945541 [Irpex rosettiformis]